jgi:uncharacterized protein YjbJ (UPF0337 family)
LFRHRRGARERVAALRNRMEDAMNQDQIKGGWNEFKGKVKEQWGKLTDDDLLQIEGDQDQLIGRVQRRYGIAREEAENQVRDFMRRH